MLPGHHFSLAVLQSTWGDIRVYTNEMITWLVVCVVIFTISFLGLRAAFRGLPKHGPAGKTLLVMAIILCVLGLGFSFCCGGCAGLVLIGGKTE